MPLSMSSFSPYLALWGSATIWIGCIYLIYIDPVLSLGLFLDFFFSLGGISAGQFRPRI